MTTLSQNTPRPYQLGAVEEYPVIASDIIYEGAAVGDNGSGYARPLVAGDPFRGFCLTPADNATGSAGDVRVKVQTHGLVELSIGSLAITDVGKTVYASDDNAFTLTQSTNTAIGYVQRYVSSGVGIVAFAANSGILAELTDNSGGTASDTIAAISDTATKNAVASVAAKVNTMIRLMGG
jgi:hypothetical protein